MVNVKKFLSNMARVAQTALFPLRMLRIRCSTYKPLSGRPDGIIVSFTSFPPRMHTLHYVLDSIMRQSLRPDKIVLVLAAEDFPGGECDIPEKVLEFRRSGLEIVFAPENLRCHLKYHHTLRAYPDAMVITVDDDSIYDRHMIERLIRAHDRYPQSVCCNIAARIDKDHFHEYRYWKKTSSEQAPDTGLVALGFAGVLYPPHTLPDELFDISGISALSPSADDLWLKAIETVAGVKVCSTGYFKKPVTVPGSQKVSLRSTNKGTENRNDTQWKRLDEYFRLKSKIWMLS